MAFPTSLGAARQPHETSGEDLSLVGRGYRPGARALPRARPSQHGEGAPGTACDLAVLWQEVLDGRLLFRSEESRAGGRQVVCEVVDAPQESRLTRIETAVLVRVLCGEQQKAVALELGIACSTASKWHGNAREKLLIDAEPIPLPLVVAAQAWATGVTPASARRTASTSEEGKALVIVHLPQVDISAETILTRAEREVAELLVDGHSRLAIAEQRKTSTQTVACQLRGIFAKMQVTGRCGLIRRAVEKGWFGG